MIVGARTIKCYGWENHYLRKVREARASQVFYVFWQSMIGSLGISVFQNGGLLAIVAIFIPKWMRGEELEEGLSMSLMAMIFFIFAAVNSMTYYAMTTIQSFLAILFRLSSVFEMDEYEFKRNTTVEKDDVRVKFEGADFSWGYRVQETFSADEKKKSDAKSPVKPKEGEKKEDSKGKSYSAALNKVKLKLDVVQKPILTDLNIDMKSGDLLVIVGEVGCGKTSLLYSIMEETILVKGTSAVNGSIAYVEQEPFIYSASVRQNIMFGSEWDEERMLLALRASQLESDLKLFGKGLNTVIGERGVNISGGQKARISLARAIYSNADIVLLDDPLSAVDPEVANKIFDECVLGALKDKVTILVTH